MIRGKAITQDLEESIMKQPESGFETADLYDRHEERLQVCNPGFRHYGGNKTFHGPMATLKCFEDNSKVCEQLDQAGEGRVLVVDGDGHQSPQECQEGVGGLRCGS
jgi:regulator of RNase E activity RraA